MRGGEPRSHGSPWHTQQQPQQAGPWGPPQGTHLCGYILVGSIFQQELDNFQVVFLRCHVEGCEAFLQTQGHAHQHNSSSSFSSSLQTYTPSTPTLTAHWTGANAYTVWVGKRKKLAMMEQSQRAGVQGSPHPERTRGMLHNSQSRRHCLPLTDTVVPCFRDVSPISQKLKSLQPHQAQERRRHSVQSCRGCWRPHGCAREASATSPARMSSACLCVLPRTPSAERPSWSPNIPQDSLPNTHTLVFFQDSGRAVLAPEQD